MRDLYSIIENVSGELYIRALKNVPSDVKEALEKAYKAEDTEIGKAVLEIILKNIKIAKDNDMLVCQDTGTPIYYVFVGEDLTINYKRLYESIKRGVSTVTKKYFLRPNCVDVITRNPRGDNVGLDIPVIHIEVDEALSSGLRIVCIPKGSGSENQSFLKMLSPADGVKGLMSFIIESIIAGASKACPPVIVGIGIGGTFESCALLAKKAACVRKLGSYHLNPKIREMEERLLKAINETGIGPMGLGGKTTALGVHIEVADTHISQLPVAVNIQCWKGQRAEALIKENLEVELT